jgi:tetratricopeptide (TPR) repeat protein
MRERGHIPEHTLSAYALDRSLVPDAEIVDAHIAECGACNEHLAEMRSFDSLLGDPASWPDFDSVQHSNPSQILEIAARIRREDEHAEFLLEPILNASPEAFVWADLPSKYQYFTGGVVRRLAAAAEAAWHTAPRHSLNLAETAIAIAGKLSTDTYTEFELSAWHGVGWKQRANALRHLGKHDDALEALSRAERFYRRLPYSEFDLASVSFIRGTIYFEQQRYDLAEVHAQTAADSFEHLGQTERFLYARHLLASIAFEKHMIDRAEGIFRTIYDYFSAANDPLWIARGEQALGNCALERGDFTTAAHLLHKALQGFQTLNVTSSAVRCTWALALITTRSGSPRVGATQLREVREAFLELGAACDAALVSLDLVEVLTRSRRSREARREASRVATIFKEAGMLKGALSAADFLKRTSATTAAPISVIEHVRQFLRRIEYQPDLAFVPPPL